MVAYEPNAFPFDSSGAEYRLALDTMRDVLGPEDARKIEGLLKTGPFVEPLGWFFSKTWGALYARDDKLPMRDRAMLLIGTDLALGRMEPLRDHIRVALHAGATVSELVEAMFQAAFYVGVPALAMGIRAASDIFAEAKTQQKEGKHMKLKDTGIHLGSINHVAMVVRDWRTAAESYGALMGLKDWKVVTIGPEMMTECTYYGKPEPCSWISAFAKTGDTLIEMCQPLTGKSVFADFLKEHGDGIQHVGNLSHPTPKELVNTWTAQGVKLGNYCDIGGMVKLYYLDSREQLGGMFLEVVEPASFAAIPGFGEDVHLG